MNANELRSGNLLKTDALLIPRLQIRSDGIQSISAYGIHLFSIGEIKLEPILITEEWFLKFGFTKRRNSFRALRIKVGDSWNGLEKIYLTMNIYKHSAFGSLAKKKIDIQYVHQLQNLYLALTGEELIIKE